MRSLEGKTAVITGGNSGIGLATAIELRRLGASVVIVGRNTDSVAESVERIGGNSLGVIADVSRVADLDRAFNEIREKVSHVDILFANAGIGKFLPVSDSTEEIFDAITDNNFKGVFFTIHRALPLIPDGGSIVLTSTVAVHFGMPGASIYAAGILAGVPLKRFGTSEEIAKSVAFLASDDAAFITGQELVADGGMSQF